MYSRYEGYQPFDPMKNRLSEHKKEPREQRRSYEPKEEPDREKEPPRKSSPAQVRDGKGGLLSGLFKNFKIHLDSDDILILAILLLLSQESDDEEILLILGLFLLMGGW